MIDFKPQVYFIDLDGTALDLPKKIQKISSKNVEMISTVCKKTPVVISTGRSNSEFVMNLAKKIGSPYVICQNGGVIVDQDNKLVVKYIIEKDDVSKISEFLQKEKMLFIFNSGNVIYGTAVKLFFISSWAKNIRRETYQNIPKIQECTKILTFGKSKKGIIKLRNMLMEKFINLSIQIVSKGYALEITNFNATKGLGDHYVCKLLNVDPSRAVHIGDSGNDLAVFPHVKNFVAMKNAQKYVKKMAVYIGPHFKKAGLGKLLYELEKN
ncbi:HAD-IIB family hydrolase [Metamycoplasma hyosynoviae]|uniref:HAD-IIB family hydrolase n=1 Tax=Metamycoplasma hyosynoviae TaxID=29559 RepID=A0A4R7TX78_9BACT|nr:HAD-IIB family hydrolase [Metamycoplasma hyosynoviae]MDD7848370.1 HAD-IIB family hydrolase [Metamycoplasma hyosynoviae]MDI3048063.1 HAD-IIB family hydrolase [Metamycoplasma hyosynoviae]MDI3102814.1 HAD-IIB family hydrolase [Metamycoplasma hyosynoviae]MDI3118191.1 HAD-IIB family hydrolase [Metamycoplasma hyosynoviae]TDU96818.1 hypothetical protein JN03_0495 [Metamycoplasma hyosynoviae]